MVDVAIPTVNVRIVMVIVALYAVPNLLLYRVILSRALVMYRSVAQRHLFYVAWIKVNGKLDVLYLRGIYNFHIFLNASMIIPSLEFWLRAFNFLAFRATPRGSTNGGMSDQGW